jgi:cell division protein FtsB
MDVVSQIPIIGSKKMQEQVKKVKKVRGLIQFLHNMLGYFQTHVWLFENKELCKVIDTKMSP